MNSTCCARARLKAYGELTKPRLTLLVILSAMTGYYLGHRGGFSWGPLCVAAFGISFVSAGSMVLNQWMEREADSRMQRTQKRPLPEGRVTPLEALIFGLLLSAAGLWILFAAGHKEAGTLSGVTLLIYLLVYTPLKCVTPYCTLIGAIPGAMPTLAGWAAAQWPLSGNAWILFAILYIWQMPHFFAISWLWRDDYVRAGFRMLSVEDVKGQRISRQIFIYTLILLPLSLLPFLLRQTGMIYFSVMMPLGIFFLTQAVRGLRDIHRAARPLFRTSIVYLSLLLILMILDKR